MSGDGEFTELSGVPGGGNGSQASSDSSAGRTDAPPSFTFYYDIGSAYAWAIGERIAKCLPEAEWQPVLQPDVDDGPLWDGDTEQIYDMAQKFGLLRPRFDDDQLHKTIADTRQMMLAAIYAKSIGRTVAFSLAAFRQIFNAAKPVDDIDTVLLAAAACEMHPRAVLPALELESTRAALAAAGAELRERVGGSTELPLLAGTAPDGSPVLASERELVELALREFRPLKN
ncbi:MAG: hypothetical protein HY827_08395 [Actinobacteria bacterium]|nr:hypothetical protein [Actinomycetota bacterium]